MNVSRGIPGWGRPALLAAAMLPAVLMATACGDDDDSPPTTAATATIAAAAAFPVNNCGFELTLTEAPSRAVSMNQAATEIMLALGLEDRMIGTAYLDDEIYPDYAEAYASVPVLAAEFPSRETFLGEDPDFAYGSYASAFGDEEGVGSRESLSDLEIGTYVSPAACADRSLRPAEVTFDTVFGEIRDIGKIFGVSDRAEELIGQLESDLDEATKDGQVGSGFSVIWYDGGSEAPTVGSCCGAPGMIMKTLGLENAFGDVPGSWGDVSWEEFVDRDPDLIVLADASWDTAEDKKSLLAEDSATRTLTAVAEERYVALPFSSTSPGIRNVFAVIEIAEFIDARLD